MGKGCEILANDGHSQYYEWPPLATFSQPCHSVNTLLITHSKFHVIYTYKHLTTPPLQHYFLASYLPTKPISTAEAVRVTMVVTTFTFGSRVGIGLSVTVTGGGTMHY